MRTSILTAIGLGAVLVSAVPLRVVVVSSSITQDVNTPTNFRMGRPAAAHNPEAMMGAMRISAGSENKMHRRPCGGRMNRFREKAIEMSNAFRQALGMPLIESDKPMEGKIVQVAPFIGTPPTFIEVTGKKDGQLEGKTRGGDVIRILPVSNMPHPHPHHHHHHQLEQQGFFTRLEQALLTLNPYEGWAVSFVLGCGLGVLLRMFWVLAIVTYRSIKGERDDEHEYSQITVIEEYAEPQEVHLPPPNYTYTDEKAPIVPDNKPAQTN